VLSIKMPKKCHRLLTFPNLNTVNLIKPVTERESRTWIQFRHSTSKATFYIICGCET